MVVIAQEFPAGEPTRSQHRSTPKAVAEGQGFAAAGSENSEEATWVDHAKAGDRNAFEQLYRAHVRRIYGLCLRMVRDPSRAEELTQDAFFRAWRKLATFKTGSSFGTWMYRLSVNVVLSHLRSTGKWKRHGLTKVDVEFELGSTAPTVPSAVDLDRAIERLPVRARLVFLLYDVEGYTHREIANLTGMAEGTSKAHLHRARRWLRGELKA